jgi:hypothetical protein
MFVGFEQYPINGRVILLIKLIHRVVSALNDNSEVGHGSPLNGCRNAAEPKYSVGHSYLILMSRWYLFV